MSSSTTKKESINEVKIPSQKFKYRRKRLLTRTYDPRNVFALVVKRDFATIPSQINNLRGQFTVGTEQIHRRYLTNDEKSR